MISSTMGLILLCLILVVPTSFSALHPSSPCPRVFTYESNEPENERWYGTVHLSTDEPIVGILLHITLDRQAEVLVSWMGKVTTEDNQKFTILKEEQRLQPGTPLNSRILVRFNPLKGSPQIRTIRLNGKQICPPDISYPNDYQPNNHESEMYETRYTTERVSQRPDLDFGHDMTGSRPKPPSRTDSNTPPSGPNPSSVYIGNEAPSGGMYSNHGGREPVAASSYGSHNHVNSHKPVVSNYSLPSSVDNNERPVGTSVTGTSVVININKVVPVPVNKPETVETHSSNNRDTSNINSQYPRGTEQGSGNSSPHKTTKRPSVNTNKNNNNNERVTTRRPTTILAPDNSGYQNIRPNRTPDLSSTENYNQPNHNQNNYNSNEKTTDKYYTNSNKGSSNSRPLSTEDSHPSYIPNSRPSTTNAGAQRRPGSKYGEQGDLETTNSNIKCGRVEVNPAPLITHGQNTARGQWPWHVALYRIEGINLSYSCGGSLITATVVVTAAHCVTKAPRDRPLDADILVVQLGKYHLYQFSDDSVQNKQVQDVIVHPRYNSSNYLDDLALLTLTTPAEFTKYVRPVCLWPSNVKWQSVIDREGTVVGWGYDENNQVTEELKMARMPVVSYVTCLKSYPLFFSQFTSENKTFCAGFRQGTSVCNGDSGGGMVFQMDNVWYLRGLVSITVAKQGLRVCDTNHYVVFTDIANYIDWINGYL